MLINFFRSNQTLALFVVPVIVGLLCLKVFVMPVHVETMEYMMPFYQWALKLMGFGTVMPIITLLVLLMFQTYFINTILSHNEVLNKKNNLLLLILPLLSTALPQFISFSPMLFVNTLLVVVFSKMLSLYKSNNPLPLIFDAGLLIALSSLFYFPAISLLLFLFICLFIIRPFSWREWAVVLMGFSAPYFLISLYYFWNDKLVYFYTELLPMCMGRGFTFGTNINGTTWAIFSLLALIFILALLKIQSNYYKTAVRGRNYIQALFILLFVAFLSLIIAPHKTISSLQILVLPLSVMLAFYFIHVKRLFMAELLLYALIATIVFNQYM